MTTIRGWKFLDPTGSTEYEGTRTVYPVPGPGDRWGPWLDPPAPAEPDGCDCGPGGWHMMLVPSAIYAPRSWWPWRAEGREIIGRSDEKARVRSIRLRRVEPRLWWRYLRRFGREAVLRGADLSWAVLRGANLSGADLSGADLSRADLRDADMRGAVLRGANLSGADLSRADLRDADMRGAVLRGANLSGAVLHGADLSWAVLRGAVLRGADLSWAVHDHTTLWPEGFTPPTQEA